MTDSIQAGWAVVQDGRGSAIGVYSNIYVAVGAGERFVLHSVAWIYDMLGSWHDLPEDLRGSSAGALSSNQHIPSGTNSHKS